MIVMEDKMKILRFLKPLVLCLVILGTMETVSSPLMAEQCRHQMIYDLCTLYCPSCEAGCYYRFCE